MMTDSSARHSLRAATAPDHARVDGAFGAFDLSTRKGYGRFLLAQAHAFLPTEAAIDAADPREFLPDWPSRRRAAALTDDLATLGLKPEDQAPGALFRSREEILGAIYVLEGSRLGGKLLERSVPADFPRSFLRSVDSALWRNFIEVLDKLLKSDDQLRLASDAAHRVFALFEAGALRHGRTSELG